MKCRIAELNIEINNRDKYLEYISQKYVADFKTPDISLTVTDQELAEEIKFSRKGTSIGVAEATAMYRKLGFVVPEFDGYILHAATFELKGRGIGFLAKSGTGKSTLMASWIKLFGDELKVINGDKPIVRLKGSIPFVHGTPWCGKEGLSENRAARLTDLCFIVRSDENRVVKLELKDVVKRLLNQVIVPNGSKNIIKTLDLIDRTVKNCNVWEIYCNTDIAAAEVSSKMLFEVN